ADDLGVDQVGCYGEGANPAPTPNIDALAARGVLFRNAWSCETCSPSRMTMMLGRHTFRDEVGEWIRYAQNNWTGPGSMVASDWTLPEVLDHAGSGYTHAAFGKWHMSQWAQGTGHPDQVGGWGEFKGSMESPKPSFFNWPYVVNGVATTNTTYATTQHVDDTVAFVQAQPSGQPWVCYLAFTAPHSPFHAPPAHLHTQNLAGLSVPGAQTSPGNIPFYKAAIEAMDTEIGRLFATLGPAVMADTNVIFLGDNGTPIGLSEPPFDPARGKTTPYEEGLGIPFVVAGPAVHGPPREETRLVSTVDVFATALDMAGALDAVPSFNVVDGISLVPYLENPASPTLRDYVFSDRWRGDRWPDPVTDASGFGRATIRNDRYKLIDRNLSAPDELYDLLLDPFEQIDLLASGPLTASAQQAYNYLKATSDGLRVAPRQVFAFGTGACVGSNGQVPTVSISGSPDIGSTYSIVLQNAAPNCIALRVDGTSELEHQGAPLPIDLTTIGAGPGCLLEHSGDVLVLAGVTTVAGSLVSGFS
ncbi:MAG: sulfatase-like hydrolase/transferase, partial [Planctomycetes bacterium]|nr:sulfatase-like hydrolase/transferase [Planctomycetota bacterium]